MEMAASRNTELQEALKSAHEAWFPWSRDFYATTALNVASELCVNLYYALEFLGLSYSVKESDQVVAEFSQIKSTLQRLAQNGYDWSVILKEEWIIRLRQSLTTLENRIAQEPTAPKATPL